MVSKGHEGGRGKPGALGNQNADVKHGGAGAVRRVQEGKPFVGLAAQEEQAVKDDLEQGGRAEMVIKLATRLTVCSNLYWNAVCTAADAGDLAKLDIYAKRFGWLASSALRAWREVREEARAAAGTGNSLDDLLDLEVKQGGTDAGD